LNVKTDKWNEFGSERLTLSAWSNMKGAITVCLLVGLSATAANVIDLAELAPCRPAAARLCDRSGGMTWNNLLQCSATLAAHSWRVGDGCRAVLKKYGQL
jgi:hypothetical protein